jgi:hypothetical protein
MPPLNKLVVPAMGCAEFLQYMNRLAQLCMHKVLEGASSFLHQSIKSTVWHTFVSCRMHFALAGGNERENTVSRNHRGCCLASQQFPSQPITGDYTQGEKVSEGRAKHFLS